MREYLKMLRLLKEARNNYKRKVLDGNVMDYEEAKKQILKLDASLKKIDSSIGSFTTVGGNYKKSL